MFSRRTLVSAVTIAGLGAALVGCTEPAAPMAEKSGSGEIRTDLQPLTSRFPALSTAIAASWMSGTMGTDAAPGPSTYWIDAIVTLPSPQIDEFQGAYSLTAQEPSVVGQLQAILPAEPLLGSPELSAAIGATALLAPRSSKVVLTWIGE